MIEPCLADDALLADIEYARGLPGQLHVWWLGQSGFLLQWNGRHVLIDPYLSDFLTNKYAATDKPHTRMTRRSVAPERLNFINVVTASHAHSDHLDPETLAPLLRVNPGAFLLAPAAIAKEALERSSVPEKQLFGMCENRYAYACGFKFHALPAAHNTIERDELNRCKFLGYVIEAGPFRIYHSGDTLLYDGLVERLRPFNLDLALLPINGDRPERRVAGNLNGVEAANLARHASVKLAVPCHYDMFEFNTESPNEFVSECKRIGQQYRVLQAGERLTVARPF